MASEKVIHFCLYIYLTTKLKKSNLHFSPNKNFAKMNLSTLPAVPQEFVNILEKTLLKLVSLNLLGKEFIAPDFLTKMRVKFSNASKKVNTHYRSTSNIASLSYSLSLSLLLLSLSCSLATVALWLYRRCRSRSLSLAPVALWRCRSRSLSLTAVALALSLLLLSLSGSATLSPLSVSL